MALEANGVSAGQRLDFRQAGSSVDIVAVATLDQTLVDSMAIWFCEVCFGRDMTSVAKIRLCPNEQVLWLLGVVRRMAVQTTDIVAGVYRSGEMPLGVAFTVAGQAAIGGLLP